MTTTPQAKLPGRMPNLLIIGAMKCGTTSLHNYLSMHPDIFMSTPKEIHFFTDQNYDLAKLDEYKNHFKTNKKIAGTSPQSYTKIHNKRLYQNIPQRIKEHTPDVKMIYIVRDPVKRYTSHILESHFAPPPKQNTNWEQFAYNYIETGKYYMQIEAYLSYFNKSQIHILSLEDLVENKLDELNKIFNFLEVAEMTDETLFNFASNTESSKDFPYAIKTNLLFRLGKRISVKLTHQIASKIRDKYFAHVMKKPQLTSEEEAKIKAALKDDVAKFREFTGMQFSQWSI